MNNASGPLLYSALLSDCARKIIHSGSEDVSGFFPGEESFNAEIGGELYNRIANVLRYKPGDSFIFIEYSANVIYEAVLTDIKKKRLAATFSRIEIVDDIKRHATSVFLAALKGKKNEDAVERLTETGASKIFFFNSDRAISHIDKEKILRFQKIAESASSQCRRLAPPVIGILKFAEIFALAEKKGAFCYPLIEPSAASGRAEINERTNKIESSFSLLKNDFTKNIFLISGPEGGFSENESSALKSAGSGFIPFTLRGTVLRAEFAPAAALAIIKYESGDY
ncbi:MAG TPA: RsmE family RNA methyltransferase [Candidatus Wallbacteria bacterium]|nr:RsmE family RNA methyltransferase [Candidatus Wallbacteria bacterium]